MRYCHGCGSEALLAGGHGWHRCEDCGSWSRPGGTPSIGPADWDAVEADAVADAVVHHQHHYDRPEGLVLGVGTDGDIGAGVAKSLRRRGWLMQGFDWGERSERLLPAPPNVAVDPGEPSRVTLAERPHRWLWRQRFAAVVSPHALDAVPNWRQLLLDCHELLLPGGLLVLLARRGPPGVSSDVRLRARQLLAPAVWRLWLERAGFLIADESLSPDAARWVARRYRTD